MSPPRAKRLSTTDLDDESLHTFLAEAAGIVNLRPQSVSNLADANSEPSISPNSLLTMKSSIVVPPQGNFVTEQSYSRKRWKNVQYGNSSGLNGVRNTFITFRSAVSGVNHSATTELKTLYL